MSGSYDRTLRVWDAKENKCLLSFQSGHSSWIFNCLLSRTKIIRYKSVLCMCVCLYVIYNPLYNNSAGQDKRIMVLDFGYGLITMD